MNEQQTAAFVEIQEALKKIIGAWREKHTNVKEFTCVLMTNGGNPNKGFSLFVTPNKKKEGAENE